MVTLTVPILPVAEGVPLAVRVAVPISSVAVVALPSAEGSSISAFSIATFTSPLFSKLTVAVTAALEWLVTVTVPLLSVQLAAVPAASYL